MAIRRGRVTALQLDQLAALGDLADQARALGDEAAALQLDAEAAALRAALSR